MLEIFFRTPNWLVHAWYNCSELDSWGGNELHHSLPIVMYTVPHRRHLWRVAIDTSLSRAIDNHLPLPSQSVITPCWHFCPTADNVVPLPAQQRRDSDNLVTEYVNIVEQYYTGKYLILYRRRWHKLPANGGNIDTFDKLLSENRETCWQLDNLTRSDIGPINVTQTIQ